MMAAAKYHHIYEILRERIEHEEYPPTSFLPSEHTLIEEFDCSRNTIRRAVQLLAKKRLRPEYPGQRSQYYLSSKRPVRVYT